MGLALLLLLTVMAQLAHSKCNVTHCETSSSEKGSIVCAFNGTDANVSFAIVMGDNVGCWFDCDIAVLYPGPSCSCPNDCFSSLGRGWCNGASGGCVCWDGWMGRDCSTPSGMVFSSFGSLQCRGVGVVVTDSQMCSCPSGYSGPYCRPNVVINALPQLIPGTYYSSKEALPDAQNPLFNLTMVSVMRLTMTDTDLRTILTPTNVYNDSIKHHVSINATIGGESFSIQDAKMHVGGAWSRHLAKKGFLIEARHKSTFGPSTGAIRKVKTKSGGADRTQVNAIVATAVFRSLLVQAPRVGLVSYWLNDIYSGIVHIYEEVNEDFLKSRWGSAQGNLYKIGAWGFLDYLGTTNVTRWEQHGYNQEMGNGNWTDLFVLTRILSDNTSTLADIERVLDVTSFVRMLAAESLLSQGDLFTCRGNNYFLYNRGSDTEPFFIPIMHDLDDNFGSKNSYNLTYWASIPLMDWGLNNTCGPGPVVVVRKLLRFAESAKLYKSTISLLLDAFLSSSSSSSQSSPLVQFVAALFGALEPYLAADPFYRLDLPVGSEQAEAMFIRQYQAYIQLRYKTARMQGF